MSQKRALAQEIRLGSPDRFPSKRVGSGDETIFPPPHESLETRLHLCVICTSHTINLLTIPLKLA